MNDIEILETLAELEQALFYKKCNPEELEPFQHVVAELHGEVKSVLERWHNLIMEDRP